MSFSFSYRRGAAAFAAAIPTLLHGQQVLEEIHVVGVPIEQSASDLAQSVTVLREETLDRIKANNLGETLANQVGVSSSYFGPGSSRPIIRGLAGARVRTMEDGIDSMDVSTVSVDHAVTIDPLVAEQIEIFRGPTTLLYGSGAVGGVVNTITNRIPEAAPERAIDGAFELRGDTVANERGGAISLDGGGDRFAWHADANSRETDDYEIPGFAELDHDEEHDQEHGEEHDEVEGILENSSLEIDSLAIGASWLGDNSLFGAAVSQFKTNYGVPGHTHAHEEHEEELVRVDIEQTRLDLKGSWNPRLDFLQTINFRFGSNDYEHVELEGDEIGTRFSNEAYEARLEFLHTPSNAWQGAFGLQVGDREFSAIGDEAFVPPVDTSSIGAFVIEQRDFERWKLSLGARWEREWQRPSGGPPDRDDDALSLSASGIRSLGNGYSIALNFASAERLPVAEELYSDGPHLASGIIEVGDPTLGVERSTHLDVSVRKTEGDLTWNLTAFITDYDDFIYLRDTGIEDPIEELEIFAYSQEDAQMIGFEAEVFTPIASLGEGEIDLRLFTDYVRGELDNGENLPLFPPFRYGGRLQYHDERFVVGVEAIRYDEHDDTAPYETVTPGYTMVNADFTWNLATDSRLGLELFLRATNLADEDARKSTSLVKDVAPLPGRNFMLGARARF